MQLNKKSLRTSVKTFFTIVSIVLFSFFVFFNSIRIKGCEDCVNENLAEEILNSESVNDDLLDVGGEQEVNPENINSNEKGNRNVYI